MRPYVLGIAGFMGSGKSTAGHYFENLGAQFINADDIVDDLYEPNNDGWLKIMNYFGREFLLKNNQVNRNKLARFVFQHPGKLQILNHMIHPLVAHEFMKLLDHAEKDIVVIEATYFEKQGLLKYVDKVLWVDCTKDVLWKRTLKRGDIDQKLFDQIWRCQKKPDSVDFTVENNGNRADFLAQLKDVWYEIQEQL